MKGIVIGGGLEGNPVIVQSTPAILIGESLAQLSVGEHFPPEEGLEVEMAESFPVSGIRTMVDATETGKEAAAIYGTRFGCHLSSRGQAEGIMGSMPPSRQGAIEARVRVVDRQVVDS
jgi:hypothetical protein